MATYTELYDLHSDSALKNKVTVACMVAAETIVAELDTEPNHANRLLWAAQVFANPQTEAERMFWALLAAENTQDTATIQGATDAAIQARVDEHVNLFATG